MLTDQSNSILIDNDFLNPVNELFGIVRSCS